MYCAGSPGSDSRAPADSVTGVSSGSRCAKSSTDKPVSTLLVSISFINAMCAFPCSLGSPQMHEDRFGVFMVDPLADAREEHLDGLGQAFVHAVEIETVGDLGAESELRYTSAKLIDVFERHDVVIEVAAGHVRSPISLTGLLMSRVKHGPQVVEFKES